MDRRASATVALTRCYTLRTARFRRFVGFTITGAMILRGDARRDKIGTTVLDNLDNYVSERTNFRWQPKGCKP